MNAAFILLLVLAFSISLEPRKIYLLWAVVLIIYAAWPVGVYAGDERLAFNLPFEYVPLLGVFGSGALSGLMRNGPLYRRFPKWLCLSAAGIILYGLASALWVTDYTSWFQYLGMWITYIALLFLVIHSLSKETPPGLFWFLDRLLFLLSGFLVIVIIRNLVVPAARYSGIEEYGLWDFSPMIRYRISQIITVLPFVPVAAMLYFASKQIRYLLFVGAAAIAIFASFSRDGIIGLIFSLLLCAILGARSSGKRLVIRPRRVVAILLVLLLGVTFAFSLGGANFVGRVFSITTIADIWGGTLNPNEPLWGRMVILRQAVEVFFQRPLLGTGMGNYLEFLGPVAEDLALSPHNLYVTYLSEFGILGFIPLMVFLVGVTHFLWKKSRETVDPRSRAILQGFFIAQLTFFVMFFATDFLVTPYVWFFWGIALAFGLSVGRTTRDRKPYAKRMAVAPALSARPALNQSSQLRED